MQTIYERTYMCRISFIGCIFLCFFVSGCVCVCDRKQENERTENFCATTKTKP